MKTSMQLWSTLSWTRSAVYPSPQSRHVLLPAKLLAPAGRHTPALTFVTIGTVYQSAYSTRGHARASRWHSAGGLP